MRLIYVIFFMLVISGCQKGTSPKDIKDTEAGGPTSSAKQQGDWTSSGADSPTRTAVSESPLEAQVQTSGSFKLSTETGILCLLDGKDVGDPNAFSNQFHSLTYYSFFLNNEDLISKDIQNLKNPYDIINHVLKQQVSGELKTGVLDSLSKIEVSMPDAKNLPSPFSTRRLSIDLPTRCKALNLSYRQTDAKTGKTSTAFLDPYFYNKLSTVEQAILILHEAYALSLGYSGHEDEDPLRILIANLFFEA